MRDDSRVEAVRQLWPSAGLTDTDDILDAFTGTAHLFEAATRATAGEDNTAVSGVGGVYEILKLLPDSVGVLPQFLDQLARALERIANDPTLFDDRLDRDDPNRNRHAAAEAQHAVGDLLAAAGQLRAAENAIDAARELTSHLGHD